MQIGLEGIGRRFNRDWIFRNISYTFEAGNAYAILGPNGSGKSTLLSVISGALSPSEGSINYQQGTELFSPEFFYRHITLAAPYLELIEEFTLAEMTAFHTQFKTLRDGLSTADVRDILQLPSAGDKQIRYFSSGMKQRVKLALALLTDSPVVLLDEPCSNLDEQGIDWYRGLVSRYAAGRVLIIGSNQAFEHDFCRYQLYISDYKMPVSTAGR